MVQSKVRLRDQHIERDIYLIYHILSYCPQYPPYFTLLWPSSHGGHMCSRFGTVTRYTYDIRTFHQSLLPCSIIVVWDEAPLKEPIRDLALHKLGVVLSGLLVVASFCSSR